MKFKAKRDHSTSVIFLISGVICTVTIVMLTVNRNIHVMDIVVCTVLTAVIGLLTWIWLDTSYQVKDSKLYYQSGPFRGSIKISQIVKVTEVSYLFAGFKPALARGGIIITYNKWYEIYIAPIDQEDMISVLLKLNPGIKF